MDGLSSMIRIRVVVVRVLILIPGWVRKFEREGCAVPWPITVDRNCPAQFPGGERATMQPKTVAILLGGKAVVENAVDIFGRNADAIVHDANLHAAFAIGHTDRQPLVGPAGLIAGAFGVADEVHKNL